MVGDAGYWHLSGAANLAYVKPVAEGVRTNVALVCASGRIYSFLVKEEGRLIWSFGWSGKKKKKRAL